MEQKYCIRKILDKYCVFIKNEFINEEGFNVVKYEALYEGNTIKSCKNYIQVQTKLTNDN